MENNLSTKLNTIDSNINVMKNNWGLEENSSIETLTNVAQLKLQDKTVELTKNGENQIVKFDEQYNGLNSINITANVTKIAPKTITFENVSEVDLNTLDTSNMTSMYNMFKNCKAQILDLENLNTSKVTSMSYMFYGMRSITKLDCSNFDTSNVTNMSYMFSETGDLLTKIDVSNFNTSKVTDMTHMFSSVRSSVGELDLSSFDTSSVTKMRQMFRDCGTPKLDIRNFDFSKVTDYSNMFYNFGDYWGNGTIIIVKDDAAKQLVNQIGGYDVSSFRKVTIKTVAEYEATQ